MRFVLICLCLILAAAPAAAQSYSEALESIAALNRVKPLQNPQMQTSKEILSRRVLDRTNKVIGRVEGALVGQTGGLDFLNVTFDRLQMTTPVYLDFRKLEIGAVTSGYVLGFKSDQIANLYPQMLADIESAAGDESVFDVKMLQNAIVRDESGRQMGQVGSVLFNKEGKRVEALYIDLKLGLLRGKSVAIPFTMAQYDPDRFKIDVTVSKNVADAMTDYVRKAQYDRD